MFDFISKIVVSIGVAVGSLFGFYTTESAIVPTTESIQVATTDNLGSTNLIAGGTYTLSGGGVSSSATSITLSSFTIPQTGQKIQDSDLSSTFYITLEPGNRSRQEVVSCTTVSQGATTATLSGCTRGISPVRPYTASTTLQFAHAGGTQVIFSDPPNVFDEMANVQNTAYITGTWGFQGTAPTSTMCATANELCNKSYVDATANAGAATSTETNGGIIELGTLAEQANSYDGGANKPTVLQTKNSTSTCQVVGSYNIVASSTTGKIDRNCIGLSESFAWSGLHTFNAGTLTTASSTNTATTSIRASSVTNNALILNGVAYAFPSTQCGANQIWRNDGAGNWSCSNSYAQQYSLIEQTDMTPTTNSYATSTLGISIPSGSFTASSTIEVNITVSVCADTGSATCSLYIRTSAGSILATADISVSNQTKEAIVKCVIAANNSTSAQKAICRWNEVISSTSLTSVSEQESTSAINLSGATTIYFVAYNNAADNFVVTNFDMRILP